MNDLDQFHKKSYLNLETFRRNGEGVRTPVWFAQEGRTFLVITMAESGKAKRIRREGRVNIAPCRADGRLTGTWVPARAREITDPQRMEKANRLLNRKYGLLKKLFDGQRSRRDSPDTYLEIKVEG
jgi:PPOX class probable F420-dependent enzyme